MIKGKKIEPVSLKLFNNSKNMQKQGGFAIGKEFMLQKKDCLPTKDHKQYQNEQDLAQANEQQMERQQKNNKEQITDKQTIKPTQIKSKNQNGWNLKTTKISQKIENAAKKSRETYSLKKENRVMNFKSTKNIKNDPIKEELSMKNRKKQQSKTDSAEINMESTKKTAENTQKQPKNKLKTPLPSLPMQQYQEIEITNQSQEEIEEERILAPQPIIQSNIEPERDYLQQISFGNHQSQNLMPQNPIRYQNSDDEECIADNYFCTTQLEEEYINGHINGQLSLDSQLFSLTAQQLLAKEYFNI